MLRVLLSLFLLSASASSSAAQTHFHHVHLNSTDPSAAIEFYTTHLSGEKAIFDGADAVWTQASWLLFNKVKQPPASEVVSPLFHGGWGAEDLKTEFERDDPVSAAAWYEKHLGLTPRNQLKTERGFRGIPTGPSA